MSGEAWDNAPNVMSESIRRSLSTGGGSGECVMVREGELVNAVCSMELNYVCLFTYSGETCTPVIQAKSVNCDKYVVSILMCFVNQLLHLCTNEKDSLTYPWPTTLQPLFIA